MLRQRVAHNIWVATLKVKVTVWPFSKTVSAHNLVFWSRFLQLFHRNNHHIKTTCRVQHLLCYLKGKGHSMTLQQNRVWPKLCYLKPLQLLLTNYFSVSNTYSGSITRFWLALVVTGIIKIHNNHTSKPIVVM